MDVRFNSMETAKKRVVGRPFTSDDPRINREGRPKNETKQLLDAILEDAISDPAVRAEAVKNLQKKLKRADPWAMGFVYDRKLGKPVEKQEQSVTLKGYVGLSPDDWDDDAGDV